ncbi:hypothetical protein AK830_g7937 [Neonectria ditissima]|uniref:Uncharacterized protein n=1 Tax=Neonectria ditissima TaxID=78410 RepID=A0A0P7ALF2_9HYPO|nr:hypothetical protein AK830_g7937 [Neonectria ditissima]
MDEPSKPCTCSSSLIPEHDAQAALTRDPFDNLPPELRIEILLHQGTLEQTITLSHASPALFRQRCASQASIIPRYVCRDLADGLVQDAMAVVLFPKATRRTDDRQHRAEVVDVHLSAWAARELPDPFSLMIMSHVLALEFLVRRLRLYIEDYLSKATSYHLPRAYRQLPTWAHRDFVTSPSQRKLVIAKTINRLSIDSLHENERRSIFKAFLRYELLCKVYSFVRRPDQELGVGAHHWPRIQVPPHYGSSSPPLYNDEAFDSLWHWDWSLLARYEDRTPLPDEIHLLACVRDYVLTMYGAIAAEDLGTTLPALISTIPEFEHAPTVEDWAEVPLKLCWRKDLVMLMASAGLDLLTYMLTSSLMDLRKLVDLLSEATVLCKPLSDIACPGVVHGPAHYTSWPALHFLRLYSQRAWPLFNDSRFYPAYHTLQRRVLIQELWITWDGSARNADGSRGIWRWSPVIIYGANSYRVLTTTAPFWKNKHLPGRLVKFPLRATVPSGLV